MVPTIIIPLSNPDTDPEGIAECAITCARMLPAYKDAGIVLVSAISIGDDVARRQAYLDLIAATIDGHVSTVVEFGDAATVILDAAATVDDPLIVMASHGRKGVALRRLNSVTYTLARLADCPMLIVPASPQTVAPRASSIQRVLVSINEPVTAEGLVDGTLAALACAQASPVALHLLEITEPIQPLPAVVTGDAFQDAHDVPAHYLRRVAARARERGVEATWSMRIGDPAREIVRAARNESSDLIALGMCGRERCGRIVPGTIAAQVTAHLSVPVLLVRPLETASAPLERHEMAHAL